MRTFIQAAMLAALFPVSSISAGAQQMGLYRCSWDDSTRISDGDKTRGNVARNLYGDRSNLAAEFELRFENGWLKFERPPAGAMTDTRAYRVITTMRGTTLYSTVGLNLNFKSARPEILVFMYDMASGRYGLTLSSSAYVAAPNGGEAFSLLDLQLAHCWPR